MHSLLRSMEAASLDDAAVVDTGGIPMDRAFAAAMPVAATSAAARMRDADGGEVSGGDREVTNDAAAGQVLGGCSGEGGLLTLFSL